MFPTLAPSGILGDEFLPANYDLAIYKGDYFQMQLTFQTGPDGSQTIMDLTGYTARAQIRANYSATVTYEFQIVMGGVAGTVDLLLPSPITSTMPAGDYIWDFQLTNPDGVNSRTYLTGDVKVYDEVTR